VSIPLIRAAGTHRDAGAAIGAQTADSIGRSLEGADFDHDLVLRYRGASVKHLPSVVEELDAAARAAGVDPLALFAQAVHELSTFSQTKVPAHCTDVAAVPELTADGHLLVAHNNDLSAGDENDVVAIEWKVEGEPTIFTLGLGPWISVGWNEAGLSITGNEVAPKDEGVGIPRLLQVRDVLTRTTLTEATRAILHPARASSYNWVVAQGEVVLSIEGSATAAEAIAPAEDGTLAHTNHYVHPEMLDLMSMSQFLLMLGGILKTIKAAGAAIELDWFRYLITRYEPTDIPQAQMVGFMQSMLAGQILENPMLKSTAISDAGLTKQTLYEVEKSAFTRSTYDRALESLDAVNAEVVTLIHRAWGRS